MKKYIIALDQGTTSSRTVLFNKKGEIVDIKQKEIEQFYPKMSWVEEDPFEILNSQIDSLKECLKSNSINPMDIDSIGITNQRETTILWNKITGKPIYNAIVWQCKRSKDICKRFNSDEIKLQIQNKTGLILDPYFSATKIIWILENIPEARDLANNGNLLFGTIDTWLLWNLSIDNCHYTDCSNASRTMLYNINTNSWDEELLELFNIPRSILPEVKPSSYNFSKLKKSFFDIEIPINSMIGDQQSALFGQLCTTSGDIKNTYGTGCFTLMNIGEKPIISKNGLLTTVAWELDHKIYYALEGSVFVGGAVIQWLRDNLGIIKDASESEEIATSVDDTNGVTFVSTFQGLGTPYWNSDVKAEITGITRGTNRAHIVRAALESIAFRTMEVINTMKEDSELQIKSIKVDGGACINNFLMEFQADILGIEVIRPTNIESTALGAAYMAGLKSGFWKSTDELKELKIVDKHFVPKMDNMKKEQLLDQWKKAISKAIGSNNGI